jgi:tetratricopeptide (TPR) repeat protein
MDVSDALEAGQAAEDSGDLVGAAAASESVLGQRDPRVAATAGLCLGRIAWKRGQLDIALARCEEARDLTIQLGDVDLRARVENAMGVLHVARAEYAQAKAAYGVALELTHDAATRAKIVLNLGVIANIQGSLDQARRYYEQSLGLAREADDDRGEALALHNIGMLHADQGAWDEAEEAYRDALALFELQGNKQMIANVLANRSEVSYGRGRTQEGIGQCDLALATYAEIGDELGRGEALRWKAHGLQKLRRSGAAVLALNESIRIAQRTHTTLLEAEATRELGKVMKADGRPREARTVFTRALELLRELGAERDVAETASELEKLKYD